MMSKFNFLFGCTIGKTLLNQTKKNTKFKVIALEAHNIAKDTVNALRKDRNDDAFNRFWEYVVQLQNKLSVEDPAEHRKRKIPARYGESPETGHFASTSRDKYRVIYFKCIAVLANAIETRFNKPDYQTFLKMQELLLKGVKEESFEEELDIIASTYSDDVDVIALKSQLEFLPGIAERKEFDGKKMNFQDMIKQMQPLSVTEREFISEVTFIVKLVLLDPATNAIRERSFSALKRLKTYMRATLGYQSLMVLHIHRNKADQLNFVDIANKFVGNNEYQKKMFGQFTDRDITKSKQFRSLATQPRKMRITVRLM